ncbi:hypothetical protein [Aeromonas rivipollensis]|uniref:Phage tail protein n=1 Tax=Aeromonas rivipollensis TaxID=948519 RepID=A0AAW9YAH9_9GAMM|nr:hypothetical protein [Aeromonas rivipollensis]NEX74798.1 hypothetical protein [Aeromonas rivipollensis]
MAGMSDASVANYLEVKVNTTIIADIETVTGFAQNANIIEFFNYGNKFSRKLVGSSSVDPLELTCTYVPESASYKALEKLRADGVRAEVVITMFENPTKLNGNTLTMTAVVGSKSISTEFDTQRTVAWTLAIDGGVTEGVKA